MSLQLLLIVKNVLGALGRWLSEKKSFTLLIVLIVGIISPNVKDSQNALRNLGIQLGICKYLKGANT